MENACTLCYNLVLHNKPHSALKKISELKGSELYKCCCCYAYLHKHDAEWEIISGGDFMGSPEQNPIAIITPKGNQPTAPAPAEQLINMNCGS